MPTRQGLTDLERGKYLPGGTNESSTVRVQHDGKIQVSTVDEVTNVESVDLIDELTHVGSMDIVAEVNHVTNVDLVDLVDNVNQIVTPLKHQDYSVVPHETYNHFLRYLLNGSSADQNVNGSVTPVDFTTTATARSLVHSFDLVIVARNLASVMDYGIVSGGLTNGIQIIRKVGGTETVIFTVRRLVEFAHPSTSGSYQAISLKSNATEDLIIVSIIVKDPIIIQTGDSLIVRIRDNLTEVASGIAYQRAAVLLKEA